jgi:hypothetical protein
MGQTGIQSLYNFNQGGQIMNVEEITLIMDSTKILKDMCSSNHAHTKSLNIELQKLVKVIMAIEERVRKLEGK